MSELGGRSWGTGDTPMPTEQAGRSIFAFVGSGTLFSDVLLRTIDAEFSAVRAIRCPDLATWEQITLGHEPPQIPMSRVLVVDERLTIDLLHLLEARPEALSRVRLAIAVRQSESAASLLSHWHAPMADYRISVLPMNLNLTAWIHLLWLIDCGEHYLPVSAIAAMQARERGETPASGSVVRDAADTGAEQNGNAPHLTPREQEVLRLVALGNPNKVIARELSVSAHTVKLHIHRIMTKMGVSNRTEAAIHYLRDRAGGTGLANDAPPPG